MTNIEDNTDKRFQQLSKATGLTTQSARNEVFKETSAAQKIFLEKVETGIKEAEKIISESVSIQKINIKESKEYIQTLFGNAVKLYDKLSTNTNEKLENFKNQGKVKGKEVLNLLTTNLPEGINSADELIEKFSNKVRTDMELEKKVEYALEQSAVLKLQLEKSESKISVLESKVEELNNIDFSGAYNGQPEESKTMTSQLLDKTKVVLDYIGRYLATKEVLGYIAGTAVGTAGAGLGLAIGGIAVGVADLYDMDRKNTKNWENIVKENSSIEGQIAILEVIKKDLGREEPVIKPDLLDNIAPFEFLKTMMEEVKENKGKGKWTIKDLENRIDSFLINLKNTEKNQLREESYTQENNDLEKLAFDFINKVFEDTTRKKEEKINEYKPCIENLETELQKIISIQKANGNSSSSGQSKMFNIDKTKEEIKELEKASTFQTILDNYERAMEKAPKVWDLLGLDDEARIKQEISKIQNLLTSLVSNDGTVVDTMEFKENKEKLNALEEELKAAEAAARMKREEENAMRNLVNVMNHFGNNLIAVGEGLNSSFLKNSGYTVNAFSSITDGFNLFKDNGGLSSITGMFKGGMAGSVKGLESITGALTSVSGIIAGVNVALSLVSSLSGKDKKKKIEKGNEENKQAFENSTTTLLGFVEAIKANISAINSYSSTLLGYATNNTTLSGIAKVEKNFDLYIKAMVDGTKDFGTVTGLVKSKTKYKSWFKSKSADTYEAVEVKEADILKSMGITNTTIDNMDENQLRDFAEKLKTTGRGDLLINLVDSNFEEWKEGVFEYVAQLDKLREEQDQLLSNSTLNAFEGIDVSSYKSLVQEYTQMFEDMGLNTDAYKDTIEEMARNAQVLVTAMQDVRSSFIEALSSGETSDFSSSMSSYFKKILNNAAQVTYDVAYSSIDEYMTKEFEKISEKLVDMKKNGVLDFNGFWDNFNFNKILEADRITTDYEKVINDLRSQLENRGFSNSLIDSMLPATELSERVDSIKSMLSSAMSEALNNNSFASFEESLGNSIYESVKDSLIQAFVDSEVYRTYMNQFYNMDDIKEKLSQAANAQQGFNLMQDYLKDLEYELEKMGLNRGNAANGNSTEENTLGNSYYQDSGIEYNITIEQNFSGVYGFDAMYDVAKKGATEAIEEWKNQGKIISTI
ncbi:hypothetical protein DW261_04020 [Fusobacterium varium]|uniref:hypothetical protein n=1 Tax=Fusobacterium varium TaxID=856 RepID=UPI000E4BE424|nr:hypothetical protein [Fusobacterium varium]RHG37064.1 hypothetical protein DW261_04020 [Fusobacterium varium]